MLNRLLVMYHQHREEWVGRVALDGLGHSLWAGRGTPSQPSLLNPACSVEAQVTSQPRLSQCGHQHRDSLTSGKNTASASSSTKPKILQGRPSPGTNPARPLKGWGVHSPLAARKKHFSRSCHGKVRVGMHNTRWHSHAVGKLHHPVPSYKEYRFFSKL